ncbi:MAG: ribonuclease Z [Gammaproteobacteria bacterium]|nr:ribonuclease Z [Gammaproteobacteria bacterium]
MNVIVLGSGTGIPSLQRNAPGYYVQTGGGLECLVDCGSSTLLQLLRAGKSHQTLDAVFITHIHPDHIGDLMALIHALRLPAQKRSKPLRIFGPPGFDDFYERIIRPAAGTPKTFPCEVIVAREEQTLNGMRIRTCPAVHSDRFESIAYRFEDAGRSAVFSGDCDYDPRIVALSRQADLLVLDSSTLEAGKTEGHLSAALCGRIASAAEAKHLLLSHFYPINGPDQLRLDECRKHYAGKTELAKDLMEVVF